MPKKFKRTVECRDIFTDESTFVKGIIVQMLYYADTDQYPKI